MKTSLSIPGGGELRLVDLKKALAAVVVFSCFGHSNARGSELLLIGGQGDNVEVTAAALRLKPWKTWASGDRWNYSLAPEWQVGVWRAQSRVDEPRIIDSSVTGALTIRPGLHEKSPFYVELGFGVHMLSHTRIGDERNFGSRFQFGEFLGLGADFGALQRYSLAARIQQVSNGGLKKPNPGVTFLQVLVTYRY